MACDRHLRDPDQQLIRALRIDAPPERVFRWLCQLRVAPYSYDWIDNLGRRSPRQLTPRLERLEVGQRFMSIFELVEFEPGRSITLVHDGPVFGRITGTYLVSALADGASRLFVRLLARYRRNPLGVALSVLLPAGDLLMMRKQLHTLGKNASV